MKEKTKYGEITLLNENGILKVDFANSAFNSTMDLIGFLKDTTLTHKLLGY